MFRQPNQSTYPMHRQLPMQQNQMMNHFNRGFMPNQAPQATRGIQGILQKIIPANTTPSSIGNVAGGGSKLMGTLNNVQQVLKVAQQATPLIKEYGPMIKNAPKLINMMKAFSELNNEDTTELESENTEKTTSQTDELSIEVESNKKNANKIKKSGPKLYI